MNWLKKLWNGEYSLPMSYWVFMVLIGNIGFTLALLIAQTLSWPMLFLALVVVGLPYTVVAMVGTWRAANAYVGWKGWAIAAQILIVFGVIRSVFDIFTAFIQ